MRASGLQRFQIPVDGQIAAAIAARASRSFVFLHFRVLAAATPTCHSRRRLAFVAASWEVQSAETLKETVVDETWINVSSFFNSR